jgi:hypothetical protein
MPMPILALVARPEVVELEEGVGVSVGDELDVVVGGLKFPLKIPGSVVFGGAVVIGGVVGGVEEGWEFDEGAVEAEQAAVLPALTEER